MADTKADGAESSLNIHPMDQFVVQPLFGEPAHAEWFQHALSLWPR